LYTGPFIERSPDLIVQWTDYAYHSRQRFGEKENTLFLDAQTMPLSRLEMNGFHKLNGALMARGNGIRRNAAVSGARIIDLAPTILYIFGLPVPADMDGQALSDIFTDEYKANKTVRHAGRAAATIRENSEAPYSEEEEAKVKERLRGLGYIE
jgi:hypothetical protein